MELTIGVDVGGTKIAAGVVDLAGTVIDEVRVSTPASTAESVERRSVTAVQQLADKHPVTAVGVAIAGFVDENRSFLRFAPNLPMAERPLRDIIAVATGLPVVIENDANAAAWGEYRFGGGRGSADVVMLTVGTGLGGGIVHGNRLLRGAFGVAGEVGHLRMVPGGLPRGCGNRGCWEQYTSGSALIRSARALARSMPDRGVRLLEFAGGDPEGISGGMVTRAAAEGDPAARELLAGVGRWLGEGIADLANLLDPAAVVVGGGVCEAGDLLLEPARAAYLALLSGAAHRPKLRIVAAELGNGAGLIGAADLARHR